MRRSSEFEIDKSGNIIVTNLLQTFLDCRGDLLLEKGIYLTGPLYIKSNTNLIFEKGAMLLVTTDETNFKLINTRVAGIEMEWYPALLNVIKQKNVHISGQGILNGNGEYWYNKYWGSDQHSGMRKYYDEVGLRWACDYDCQRPRNLLISDSNNVIVEEITSYNSGFWNIHVLYSNDVRINKVNIESGSTNGPSTDGIDIDSSYDILVENVTTKCNDDSICIKSGRDYDGLRVNRPCHDITIRNCNLLRGYGITIGSEVSGGIYNIDISNIKYDGTDCGFRIKSSYPRKGYIKNINLSNLTMHNVKYCFHLFLNWNPNYSICEIPKEFSGEIKPYYLVMTKKTGGIENTLVENITINNVTSNYDNDYNGISRCFNIVGYNDQHIRNITIANMKCRCKEYGIVEYVDNFNLIDSDIEYDIIHEKKNDDFDNR